MPAIRFDREIVLEDIVEVVLLNYRGVFKVVGENNSAVVIKVEQTESGVLPVKQTFEIMTVVDPNARVKPLSHKELAALRVFADRLKLNAKDKPVTKEEREYADLAGQLHARVNGEFSAWIKMEYLKLGDLSKDNDVAAISQALNEMGGYEHLGQILAVDMFVGNNDRFDFTGVMRGEHNTGINHLGKYQLHYLSNLGNVMIVYGDKTQIIGMDAFDKNAPGLMLPVANNWPFQIFHPKNRKKYLPIVAANIIADLNVVITVRDNKTALNKNRAGKTAVQRLQMGLLLGALKIEEFFTQKYTRGFVGEGIKQRAELAGWTDFQGSKSSLAMFQESVKNLPPKTPLYN